MQRVESALAWFLFAVNRIGINAGYSLNYLSPRLCFLCFGQAIAVHQFFHCNKLARVEKIDRLVSRLIAATSAAMQIASIIISQSISHSVAMSLVIIIPLIF